jgi:hypothetical protein
LQTDLTNEVVTVDPLLEFEQSLPFSKTHIIDLWNLLVREADEHPDPDFVRIAELPKLFMGSESLETREEWKAGTVFSKIVSQSVYRPKECTNRTLVCFEYLCLQAVPLCKGTKQEKAEILFHALH